MSDRLDIVATVGEAYKGAWGHLGEMIRLIWLPVILYLAISLIGMFVNPGEQLALALLLNLATLFLWPVIAVAWHRFILIGDAPPGRFHFSFGRREARFLMISVFLILLLVPGGLLMEGGVTLAERQPQSMTGSLLSFFGLLILFVSIYFSIRLSLLLPAVSVDDPVNPRLILERTRGNFWRLVAVIILVALPVLIIALLLGALFSGGPVLAVAAAVALAFISIFFAVVNVAVLSVAYRELVGPPGTQPLDRDDADLN
ncbi:MAG: hypothetical protein CVT73_03270 [Alphaproteobacteria bacterium HGW-Alphaproteobacteria-12]|nr:MAG: hypothetical protein CVT73_03270 [Alphaproteobacteria bacterium HGW-Alphaproteobacteria-12]